MTTLKDSIDVRLLEDNSNGRVTVLLFKLTDEALTSLKNAQQAGQSVQLNIGDSKGTLSVHETEAFNFHVSPLVDTSPADALCLRTDRYQLLAPILSKIQVKATDKSFSERRERAQKLVDVDRKKLTKNVKEPFVQRRVVTGGGTGDGRPAMSASLKAELLKKTLRQRIVHLLVLGKFNQSAIFNRLRKDGLNSDINLASAQKFVDEMGEASPDGYLSLKSNFLMEVDQKWQWFTTDEKVSVKRLISGSNESNFAPKRKMNILPPQAPLGPVTATPKSTLKTASVDGKRKASNGLDEKMTTDDMIVEEQIKRMAHGGIAGGDKERKLKGKEHKPVTCSLDYLSQFGEISTEKQADDYCQLFHREYPHYIRCYKILANVAEEFSSLDKRLKEAPIGTKEHKKLERQIQTKFWHYDEDGQFQRTRREHAELRAKLAAIKSRLQDRLNT